VHIGALIPHIARHARERGADTAISKGRAEAGFHVTTWAELWRRTEGWAAFLDTAAADQHLVPVLAGKSADSIAAGLGLMASGRAFSFVNPKYRMPQVAAVLAAVAPRVCVIDATGLLALRGVADNTALVGRTTWLLIGGDPPTSVHAAALRDLRAAANVVEVPEPFATAPPIDGAAAPAVDRVGACLFTSGSTGEPKGVLVSEADLIGRAEAEIDWFGLDRSDVLLSLLPFSFDVGLNQLLTALAVGAELVLLESWLPADILAATAARGVTGISGVPAIWQDLVNSGLRFDGTGPHARLRYLTVSGGSLAPRALDALRDVAPGVGIFKTYGQTEAFRATSLRPEEIERVSGSVGRAFPGARVYVVDDDGGLCAPGDEGEVVHTGLGVMMGYLRGAELRPDPADKLRANPFFGPDDLAPNAIFTGDIGVLDGEGYLFLKGRRDGMVKVMGNRVYPEEVAKELAALPGVVDAAVAGAVGADGLGLLIGFVALKEGAESTPARFRKWLGAKLPGFMIPRRFVVVDHIPRGATGKPAIRQLLEEHGGAAAGSDDT